VHSFGGGTGFSQDFQEGPASQYVPKDLLTVASPHFAGLEPGSRSLVQMNSTQKESSELGFDEPFPSEGGGTPFDGGGQLHFRGMRQTFPKQAHWDSGFSLSDANVSDAARKKSTTFVDASTSAYVENLLLRSSLRSTRSESIVRGEGDVQGFLQSAAQDSSLVQPMPQWADSIGAVGQRVIEGISAASRIVADQVKDIPIQWDDRKSRAGEKIHSAVQLALSRVSIGREKAKAKLLDVSAPLRQQMMDSLRSMIRRGIVEDPDMWSWVRVGFEAAVDHIWRDLEKEIEQNIEAALLKQHTANFEQGPSGGFVCIVYCKLRASVLHHYLPHDRSFFGKLKDIFYIFLTAVILLPVSFVRVAFFALLLVMLLHPGPPDECQLVNFIIYFKGTQFLNAGLFMMARGCMAYFTCYSLHKETVLECIDTGGPGTSGDVLPSLVDYLGCAVLVWVAFNGLRRSEKHAAPRYVGRRKRKQKQEKRQQVRFTLHSPESALDKNGGDVSNGEEGLCSAADNMCTDAEISSSTSRGGRLARLLHYDIACFLLSIVWLVLWTVFTCRDDFQQFGSILHVMRTSQFKQNLYWCKVFYGLLSLPFLPFIIPFFCKLLTHCEWTGYNEQGACVAYQLPLIGDIRASRTLDLDVIKDGVNYAMDCTTNALRKSRSRLTMHSEAGE
jgi:hypothetical protein